MENINITSRINTIPRKRRRNNKNPHFYAYFMHEFEGLFFIAYLVDIINFLYYSPTSIKNSHLPKRRWLRKGIVTPLIGYHILKDMSRTFYKKNNRDRN